MGNETCQWLQHTIAFVEPIIQNRNSFYTDQYGHRKDEPSVECSLPIKRQKIPVTQFIIKHPFNKNKHLWLKLKSTIYNEAQSDSLTTSAPTVTELNLVCVDKKIIYLIPIRKSHGLPIAKMPYEI